MTALPVTARLAPARLPAVDLRLVMASSAGLPRLIDLQESRTRTRTNDADLERYLMAALQVTHREDRPPAPLTFREIAALMGVSAQHVEHVEKRAMTKVRKALQGAERRAMLNRTGPGIRDRRSGGARCT